MGASCSRIIGGACGRQGPFLHGKREKGVLGLSILIKDAGKVFLAGFPLIIG